MMRKIAVIGAGTMGAGIAQLAAQSGFDVLMYDVQQEFVERGLSNIRAALQGRVDKGKLEAADMQAVLDRIATGVNRDEAAESVLPSASAPGPTQSWQATPLPSQSRLLPRHRVTPVVLWGCTSLTRPP
jgi:3-hydroxyisobutyrate dehydrogenase-like beta-hydroxyacid dehydrogenase